MKKTLLLIAAALVLMLTAAPAMAGITFDFTKMSGLQGEFKDFSTEAGLAMSYVPLAPAEPLGGGILPRVDVGVEATAVTIDKSASFWQNAVTNPGDLPSALIFPKFHAQVGIPVVPIDLGFMYAQVANSDIKLVGFEIKYAILKGGALSPALAVRGAYTRLSGVSVLDIDTKSLDVSISKGFLMLTPYAGIGEVWITSTPNQAVGLQKENITQTKGFVGLKFSFLPVLNMVAEADFAKVNEYSLRLNLHF